jgi:starvation-inducible DNA-binding protein
MLEPEIGISAEDREHVAQLLNYTLGDHVALWIQLKSYHWNVYGLHFDQLHELFEHLAVEVQNQIDDIAERIRTLGVFTPTNLLAFNNLSRLKEDHTIGQRAPQLLEAALHNYETIIRQLRVDVELTATSYNDSGTSDFLTGLMAQHEKRAWLLRAHLES